MYFSKFWPPEGAFKKIKGYIHGGFLKTNPVRYK